jgi:hypothetical protein
MRGVLIVALALAVQAGTEAQRPMSKHAWLDEQLAAVRHRGELVLASRCTNTVPVADFRRTTLLLVPAERSGYLVEEAGTAAETWVANIATFSLKQGQIVDLETNGGEYSYKRVRTQIEALFEVPFKLLRPVRVEEWAAIPSSTTCLPL